MPVSDYTEKVPAVTRKTVGSTIGYPPAKEKELAMVNGLRKGGNPRLSKFAY